MVSWGVFFSELEDLFFRASFFGVGRVRDLCLKFPRVLKKAPEFFVHRLHVLIPVNTNALCLRETVVAKGFVSWT